MYVCMCMYICTYVGMCYIYVYIRYSGEKTKTIFLKNLSTYCFLVFFICVYIYGCMYVYVYMMNVYIKYFIYMCMCVCV